MVAVIDVLAWDEGNTEQDRERFRIENDEQATWAMRKLTAARARLDEIAHIAEAEIQRIQAWAERESREPMRDVEYFEGVLTEYGITQRAEGRKTVSTPYGSIKSRMGQPKYTFLDKDQFIEWAKANHPDWVAVKEEPALSVIKAATSEPVDPDTGEVIPGLTVDPASISYSIEVSK